MHLKLCMFEHFDSMTKPFKYKSETYQVFILPLKKIMRIAKCNSEQW
jgi:hypothetical protein